jgi:site-specific DNA recombinase
MNTTKRIEMTRKQRKAKQKSATRMIGYCRVSTDEQAEHGVSLAAQRRKIRAQCEAQGYELLTILSDEGISGTVPPSQRPALSEALESIGNGDADGICCIKLDRLSRRTRDILELSDDAERNEWRLDVIQERLDTGSPVGRFTLTILAGLAELERDQIALRTQDAVDHVAKEGRPRSRYTPYGYRNAEGGFQTIQGDKRPLVPHSVEQKAIRKLQRLRNQGVSIRSTVHKMGKALNPRTGKAWTASSIQSIYKRLLGWDDIELKPTG